MRRELWIIAAGFMAAVHVGKLPASVPVLKQELGLTLVQAGILLSLVQGAGMLLALVLGSYSQRIGLKRCMLLGLSVLGVASTLGGMFSSLNLLLLLRACEGLGFLLVTLTGAAYLRELVHADQLQKALGLWSAYMGGGMGIALLLTPWLLHSTVWQGVWVIYGITSFILAVIIYFSLPNTRSNTQQHVGQILKITLAHRPAWLLALIFALYAGQWLCLVGFLPTIYAENHIPLTIAGSLTAFVAISNALGTALCGRLLQRGYQAVTLIRVGFVVITVCAVSFYTLQAELNFALQYLCVVMFSLVGGLIPASVFSCAMYVAPQPSAIPATIGLTLQCSALAQFVFPPFCAMLVAATHSWASVGISMMILSFIALVLVHLLFKQPLGLTNQQG